MWNVLYLDNANLYLRKLIKSSNQNFSNKPATQPQKTHQKGIIINWEFKFDTY